MVAELYGLRPGDFTSARDARAAALAGAEARLQVAMRRLVDATVVFAKRKSEL